MPRMIGYIYSAITVADSNTINICCVTTAAETTKLSKNLCAFSVN